MTKAANFGVCIAAWTLACGMAIAAEPPSDLCSLLSPSAVSKALGKTFAAPTKTAAPRAFKDTPEGTDCHYKADRGLLLFRVYVDASPDASKATFAKLAMWFKHDSTPSGIGDEAYFDDQHAIHVRKGKTRFFMDAGSSAVVEDPIKQLATEVSGKL